MQPRPVRLVPQLVPQLVPDAASHVAPATAAPIAMGSHGSSMAPRMVMGSMSLVSAAVACRKHRKLSGIRSVNANLTRCRAEGEADPLLAEAKAAAEAAKLQLEAAKLRAEADELRKATATAQRKERAVRILGSD